MITLLRHRDLNKYKTVWTKDVPRLTEMFFNGQMFRRDGFKTRWEIVQDKQEVKKILEDNFSSKGRGVEYTEGLPSGTVITSSLFPVDLTTELFKLTWLANEDLDKIKEQEKTNLISLEMGTYIHKCLELWAVSDIPMAKRNFEEILEQVREDKEILCKVKNFSTDIEKRMRYEQCARNIIPKFIQEHLCKFDIIGSEIFMNTGKIQGSVDLLATKRGEYYLIDHKTTRRVYKMTGGRKFSSPKDMIDYERQICLYSDMLIELGIIPKSERDKINYRIYQFHLISDEYKEFRFENSEIQKHINDIRLVEEWYWGIKNG